MFASSSGTRVAVNGETVWGVPETSPTFQELRVTNRGLRTAKQTAASAERRADRNVPDLLLLSLGAGGGYDFEWSYSDHLAIMQSALFSRWPTVAPFEIKNGIDPYYMTLEETLELGTTDSFSRFSGAMVSRYSLSLRARQIVTGTVEFLAKSEVLATAILSGATYAPANAYPIATASANVAGLVIGAITPAPKVMSLDFQIDNRLRERPVIGSLYSQEFGSGRCEVTGNMSCYFESNDLYQAALDHESASLDFVLGDPSARHWEVHFPKIFFGNVERVVGGNDEDVMVNLPWQAVYDDVTDCTIRIVRETS
jgi:hypothetical protein